MSVTATTSPAPRPIPCSWSIGILQGRSLVRLNRCREPANPVLTCEDVTDMRAAFVADPFLAPTDDGWYMFFEALEGQRNQGVICCAYSADGLDWEYRQIVLQQDYHLSYPFVFRDGGADYMLPETLGRESVVLFRAERFPDRWREVAELIPGRFADPTLFSHAGAWWLFVCDANRRHDTLRLFNAPQLLGPWSEHPRSPLITADPCHARPAGRVVWLDGSPIRFAQDCSEMYGRKVRAFVIEELTASSYRECPLADAPLLSHGTPGWSVRKMHHIDAHWLTPAQRWLAAVDGYYEN